MNPTCQRQKANRVLLKHPLTTQTPEDPADHWTGGRGGYSGEGGGGDWGGRRRWRENSSCLHAVVRKVVHLDRLSD